MNVDAQPKAGRQPKVDRLVVARAAAYGQLLALPGALANSSWSGRDDVSDGLVALSFFAVLAGLAIAGFAAGVNAEREVARHGAYAALLAFFPAELFAISGRLDRGDPIRLPTIVVHAAIAAAIGLLFVRLGAARRAQKAAHPAPNPQEGS